MVATPNNWWIDCRLLKSGDFGVHKTLGVLCEIDVLIGTILLFQTNGYRDWLIDSRMVMFALSNGTVK